jgi:hypothetical protein
MLDICYQLRRVQGELLDGVVPAKGEKCALGAVDTDAQNII